MAKRLRASAAAGTDLGTPWAEKITGASGLGHLVELADEDRALPPQAFHDVFVVHDLVAHIDRRAMDRERLLDRIDGTDDPGAEAARGTEQNVEGRLRHDQAMWRDEAPPVKRERRLFAAGRSRFQSGNGCHSRPERQVGGEGNPPIAASAFCRWIPCPDLRPYPVR